MRIKYLREGVEKTMSENFGLVWFGRRREHRHRELAVFVLVDGDGEKHGKGRKPFAVCVCVSRQQPSNCFVVCIYSIYSGM